MPSAFCPYEAAPQTLTGQISDSMCGKSHVGIGDMGKNPKECTMDAVKTGARYIFVSGDKVYEIKNQKLPRSRPTPVRVSD